MNHLPACRACIQFLEVGQKESALNVFVAHQETMCGRRRAMARKSIVRLQPSYAEKSSKCQLGVSVWHVLGSSQTVLFNVLPIETGTHIYNECLRLGSSNGIGQPLRLSAFVETWVAADSSRGTVKTFCTRMASMGRLRDGLALWTSNKRSSHMGLKPTCNEDYQPKGQTTACA